MHYLQFLRRVTPVLLAALFLSGCGRQKNGPVGEWHGTGMDGERFVLVLEPDRSFRMITGGQAIDASTHRDTRYQWTADATHTPHRLTLTTIEGDRQLAIPVIYNLIDQDTLAIRFGVTPRGEPVAWEQLAWDVEGQGSKRLVLERARPGN